MDRRKLPAGIQTFREIREEGYYYTEADLDNESLLDRLAPDPRREERGDRLYERLAAGDAAGLEGVFRSLLAGIPHDWHRQRGIV